jgi:hypothetical protein
MNASGQPIPSTEKYIFMKGQIGKFDLAQIFPNHLVTGRTYKVTLRLENGCSEPDIVSKTINIKNCTKVDTNGGGGIERVLVYPNPVLETLNIEYALDRSMQVKIELVSLISDYRYTLKETTNEDLGMHYYSVDIPEDIIGGNFVINITTETGIVTQPIFIEK